VSPRHKRTAPPLDSQYSCDHSGATAASAVQNAWIGAGKHIVIENVSENASGYQRGQYSVASPARDAKHEPATSSCRSTEGRGIDEGVNFSPNTYYAHGHRVVMGEEP